MARSLTRAVAETHASRERVSQCHVDSTRVGNDVVDLGDPRIAEVRERFVVRVCCEEERARIAASPEPRRLLWSLFAVKEAAYKVVSKLGPRPVFAHRRFVVAEDLRSVSHEGRVLSAWIHEEDALIHALVSTTPARPPSEIGLVGQGDPLRDGAQPPRGRARAKARVSRRGD